MSARDLAALPQPEHLTLLFKHGKSTTLLSILPTQEFHAAAQMLLAALHSRNIFTFPDTDTALPTAPEDIELAVLTDRRDYSKGWVLVDEASSNAKAGKKKANPESATTFGDLGCKDGDWVAYRLKRQLPEVEDDESIPDATAMDDPGWHVIIPSYDDEQDEDIEVPLPSNAVAGPK